MTLLEIKKALRNGQYAWPGGYPMFFIPTVGGSLSFAAVRREWRQVVRAHISGDRNDEWHLAAVEINWEDAGLYCDHTSERIESAYAEDGQ